MKYTSQRGTKDILPEEVYIWQAMEKTCRKTFELYNYKEIRTPIFEQTELFSRSIGATTDIVSKEMYTFPDRKGRSLTLRPEETAPVVRASIQNNLLSKENTTKLYYIGPMFRYERPQAGRQRQFHQAGVEVFGSSDPTIDAEVILLAEQIFSRLGLPDLEIDINSVGCSKCRPEYLKKIKAHFADNLKDMCDDCQKRFESNPLRILDCKEPHCQKFIEKAPATRDTLCPDCKSHFEKLIELLAGVKYRINNRLVRGLDYYTRTTFEIVSKQLGAQNAVCGGGRYDTLVEELGGSSTPAVGFAIGLERLVEIIKSKIQNPKSQQGILLYVAVLGEEARKIGFDFILKARKAGISADMDFIGKGLKAQMKAADRQKAKYVLIIGDEEIKKNKFILKNMRTAKQEEASLKEIIQKLQII
ncbi:MAG: histidine--tRNA ligase [Candidatus Margulisiibacteriota bacterium]